MPIVPTARPDGRKIREFRKLADLTVEQLARRVGRHSGTITQIECGRKPKISTVMLRQIATAIGATPAEITLPGEVTGPATERLAG